MATAPEKKSQTSNHKSQSLEAAAKKRKAAAAEREFANLKLKEEKLKDKIENRIPKFSNIDPGAQDAAIERAERHLAEVREAIKNHPQNKS